MLGLILTFSLLGSVGALLASASLLLFPVVVRQSLVPNLISYATGTLLGAAFLGMIPAGLQKAAPFYFSVALLTGILLFFLLEKFLLWRHCHEDQTCQESAAAPLILVGDAFHNLVDGVLIASAFLISIPLGISVSLAVIAHEIPQEVGDFAILLEHGYSRRKALLLNGLSSIATVPGAILAYLWLDQVSALVPYILALSAASFIYIALSDLVPVLSKSVGKGATVRQLILILAGVATIALFHHGQ
ncbi:ZIP family metal transporter [Sedimenticola sp.]|uniref:ZIP family metal transporter n=1 Tax=Sedimenticola sp. TaxID=1940285 RepID=UPI003D0F889B